MIKSSMMAVMLGTACMIITGCDLEESTRMAEYREQAKTQGVTAKLSRAQPTPTDIQYSLERYNLIRRAYWVNGMKDRASSLTCPVVKPMGYVILISNGTVIGRFTVDGKVSSLQNYLTPVSEDYGQSQGTNRWMADIDGTYGDNDKGIFFFTTDGKYIEWNGNYLYSDIPFNVKDPVLNISSNSVE